MAYPGLVIENPLQRTRIEFVQTRETTDGAVLETVARLEASGGVARGHLHPLQEERFEVVSGRLWVSVGGEGRVLGPGDSLAVPAGTVHGLANAGAQPCRVRGLQAAVLMHGRFRDHLYLAGPPVWAQKLLFALLAPIGRLRGYRDDYPEYIRYIRDRPIAPGTAAAAGSAR